MMRYIARQVLALTLLTVCSVLAQPQIRTSVDTLNIELQRFTSAEKPLVLYNDGNQPLTVSITDEAMATAQPSQQRPQFPANWREKLTAHLQQLKNSAVFEQLKAAAQPALPQTPMAVLISDSLNDTNFPGLDIVSVDFTEDLFFYTFKLNYTDAPDTSSVAVLSLDVDQNLATGSFPVPLGLGPVFFDIGSEYEVLFDVGGVLSDTLNIPPSAIVIEGGDTTLTPVAVTLLTFGGNSVTAAFIKAIAPDFDLDGNMNAAAITLPLGTLGLPDFAPDYGHGLLGSEPGVSWLAQSDATGASAIPLEREVAAGDSLEITVTVAGVMPEGNHEALLKIASNSSTQPLLNLPVNVTIGGISQAVIGVSPAVLADTLQENVPPAMHVLSVSNTGTGTLTCFVSDSLLNGSGWLSVEGLPVFQVDSGDSVSVIVQLNPAGLTAGTVYEARIFFNSNDLNNPRVAVPVSLFIQPGVGIAQDTGLPESFALAANYPNPFNPETTITFSMPSAAEVRLSVVDITGKEVRRLIDGFHAAGVHALRWDGRDTRGNAVASGVYLLSFSTPAGIFTQKMMLVR